MAIGIRDVSTVSLHTWVLQDVPTAGRAVACNPPKADHLITTRFSSHSSARPMLSVNRWRYAVLVEVNSLS